MRRREHFKVILSSRQPENPYDLWWTTFRRFVNPVQCAHINLSKSDVFKLERTSRRRRDDIQTFGFFMLQLPLFRVTLFYGPEPAEGDPARLTCVFNVKKRSWKGGVQIAVEVSAAQAAQLQQALSVRAWIAEWLAAIPEEDRPSYEGRACDLFVQEICSMKLALALDRDVRQDNSAVSVDTFVEELDRQVHAAADRIKSNILTELDLHPR